MPSTLIVNSEPPELRVAEIRDGRLFSLDVERGDRALGNVYVGLVTNVVPGMEAYFVDIGHVKKGLLQFRDCAGVQKKTADGRPMLKVGNKVLVQITKPAVGSKGPRLTSRISLPGRFVVLVAPWDTVGVSRRIEIESERLRLRDIAERYRPLDYGLIVRTEAENALEDDIRQDVEELTEKISNLYKLFENEGGAVLLQRDLGLLGRVVRDRLNADFAQIVVDTPEDFAACQKLISATAPHLATQVVLYDKARPIFEHYGVEKSIARTRQKEVALPHGGNLIIEETEALTAIDVNTAKFIGKSKLADTILQTNLEAVDEAALQMRLRGIGGVIVIDFIDMERTRDRIRVLDALETALKLDRAKTHIIQLSPSGLVEITRRREGLSQRQLSTRKCERCDGDGLVKSAETVAIETRRRVRQLALQNPPAFIKVTLHPEVACQFLGSAGSHVAALEKSTLASITVRVDSRMSTDSSQVESLRTAVQNPEAKSERFTLGMHDKFYPSEEPEFVVWNDFLVVLPPEVPAETDKLRPLNVIVLEIQSFGPWFATARVKRMPPA